MDTFSSVNSNNSSQYNEGMKILVTGGHPAPALAVIDYALSREEFINLNFIFVGRKFNNLREKTFSFEYKEISDRKIPFYNLNAGRVTRLFSVNSFRNVLHIPFGFFNAWRILLKTKPDRVLTFGGYLALPIAYVAKVMGIPVFIHEQTIAPGIATQKISKLAKKVFLSFPDSQKNLPIEKCIVTGNLVREAVFEKKELPFLILKDTPVLYITGGSLGSHSLNQHIQSILPQLIKFFFVIHQAGNISEFQDYEKLKDVRASLPQDQKNRYIILDHIPAKYIGSIFAATDILVSRSGANTVTELVALKKPAVLVPLPWSARNEQGLQAQMLQKAGVAKVFEQNKKSSELLQTIMEVYEKRSEMKTHFKQLEILYNPNAPRVVLEEVLKG